MRPYTSTDLLERKRIQVTSFFQYEVGWFRDELARLGREIPRDEVPSKNDTWREVEAIFQESQDACRRFEERYGADRQLLQEVQDGFRTETDAWFRDSWIAHRARTKPSGFPGDYEMLLKLYAEETEARGLGGYLDLCISELPLARAVRSRMENVRDFLRAELAHRHGAVRILDIASGPCQEYVGWQEPINGSQVEVVCLDNDPKALDYVGNTVVPAAPGIASFRIERYNALRTRSASTNRRKFGACDILYSVGLCDYLTDEHLVGMLAAWRETLAEDGIMYVAFKDGTRYDKTPYQWHLDWHFYQRTEQQCWDLFAQAGCNVEQMVMTRDGTGIIMNFILGKHASRVIRVDRGATSTPSPVVPASHVLDQ